ncbi:MAG: class IV adenylate cyclase [Gemmatimonadetes bacterium]|nr:class IV adenylate cyclase [Gemmatimonadota bacterium]
MPEVEIKARVRDPEETVKRLETLGARLVRPRAFEDNVLWDLPGRPLAGAGRLLRVRTTAGRTIVTAKGPAAADSRFKVRPESEMEIADDVAFAAVLATAGFERSWRYQKWRREYEFGGTSIVIDEIPHGTFLEIEGERDAIDAIAAALGVGESDRILATYRDIHEQTCGDGPVGDMVFPGAR